MASDDENRDLHNQIAVLKAELEEWRKFARVVGDFFRRAGSLRFSPGETRVLLQAAMDGRITVAPVTTGAKDDELNRLARIADAQNAVRARDLPRAIEIYAELCEQYPDETRFRLKLGDCYARTGNLARATETYLAVARQYDAQGSFLKAVAVYKQILTMSGQQQRGVRLSRKTIADVHYALAKMYDRLNLRADALSQYEECYRLTDEGDVFSVSLGEEIVRHGGNPQGLHD